MRYSTFWLGAIAIPAIAAGQPIPADAADPSPVIEQIASGRKEILAPPPTARTTSAPPQLTKEAPGVSPAPQLTKERGTNALSAQVYRGPRTAEPAQSLSRPADGRTAAVERVGGKDRCDPAETKAPSNNSCSKVIETRAAEFARPDPAILSPEQRILMEQQLRERSASISGASRRLATTGDGANTMAGQEVASIVLGRSSDAADKKEKPEESPQLSEEAAAIVNAIVNQPAAPQ